LNPEDKPPEQGSPQLPPQKPQAPDGGDSAQPAPAAYPEDRDALLAEELTLLMNEFQVEMVEGAISRVRIYLTVSLEMNFVIGIDFSAFPEKPLLTVQDELKSIANPDDLASMKNWTPGQTHVIDVVRELEWKLSSAEKLKMQARLIMGEFKAKQLDEHHLAVDLLTFGLREYRVDVNLDALPAAPTLEFSPELQAIMKIRPEDLNSIKSWDMSIMSTNDILREIQWEVDKVARLQFERDLLYGLERVEYLEDQRKLLVDMRGKMKTADTVFKFEVELPEDYPTSKPVIKLLNEITDDEIAKKLEQGMKVLENWSSFTYLVDIFDAISKEIMKASIISCIICHQTKCPACSKPMIVIESQISAAAEDPANDHSSETCYTECPHCQKPYHAHCWEQNIKAIGKCAYCMREPTPSMPGELNSEEPM